MRLTAARRLAGLKLNGFSPKLDAKITKEAAQIINSVNREVVYRKISDVNNWYKRLIGLDEVKLYQDRVIALQERLLAAQEKRRAVAQQLADVRRKSNELQDQIHKVKRQDDLQRFLELMKAETEVLKQEQDVNQAFAECDREERETFAAFTNAVRDSHEKQRAQVEYTKYFGLVLSIAGSFLAFCYSTLNKHDLKKLIKESLERAPARETAILGGLRDNARLLNEIKVILAAAAETSSKTTDEYAAANGDRAEGKIEELGSLEDLKGMLLNNYKRVFAEKEGATVGGGKSDTVYWTKVSLVGAAAASIVYFILLRS